MDPLERITERVRRYGDVNDRDTPRPLLTLEEFFDGNSWAGSIGCNINPTPTPTEFQLVLKQILDRPEVFDVRVHVTMFDDPEGWPFSDTIWVITSASHLVVPTWFDERFMPDGCYSGWNPDTKFEPYQVPLGLHPVACWWD